MKNFNFLKNLNSELKNFHFWKISIQNWKIFIQNWKNYFNSELKNEREAIFNDGEAIFDDMEAVLKSSILSRPAGRPGRPAGWLDSIENKTKQGQIAWLCFAFGLCLAIVDCRPNQQSCSISRSIYSTVVGVDFTVPNEGNSWNILHEAQPSVKYFNCCPSLVRWNPRPTTVEYMIYTTFCCFDSFPFITAKNLCRL